MVCTVEGGRDWRAGADEIRVTKVQGQDRSGGPRKAQLT